MMNILSDIDNKKGVCIPQKRSGATKEAAEAVIVARKKKKMVRNSGAFARRT